MNFDAIKLSTNDLTRPFFDHTLFVSVAEGGAMGEPGSVEIIDDKGQYYHFNTLFGDVEYGAFLSAFPTIEECSFGMFGYDSEVPNGWNYVNLGMGNHLIVRDEIYSQFVPHISQC